MGFGCNAAGIVGCRIIDSKRERLLAILTNAFVPCNGKYPTLIAVIAMFFAGTGFLGSFRAALILTGLILLGIGMTFISSYLLSKTMIKGIPSSFTLELPPYRKPQLGKVIVRSICDRTFFVLTRAVAVAAPAGILLFVLANISINQVSLIQYMADFLNPLGQFMGLDGVILAAFILGFPANEIVVPIMIMIYLSNNSIMEFEQLGQLHQLLVARGWTWITAVCMLIFMLFHWPCSTTCITIYKETKSLKWTITAFLLPTGVGILICSVITRLASLL